MNHCLRAMNLAQRTGNLESANDLTHVSREEIGGLTPVNKQEKDVYCVNKSDNTQLYVLEVLTHFI